MSDLTDRLRNPTITAALSTHSDVCWQWHDQCAARRAAELIDAIDAIVTREISRRYSSNERTT